MNPLEVECGSSTATSAMIYEPGLVASWPAAQLATSCHQSRQPIALCASVCVCLRGHAKLLPGQGLIMRSLSGSGTGKLHLPPYLEQAASRGAAGEAAEEGNRSRASDQSGSQRSHQQL